MADEHDTSDRDDSADPDAIRTVHGGEPLAWPLRLATYFVVAVMWFGVYSVWEITGEILTYTSSIFTTLLFIGIVVVYQFLLELSLRRWPKMSKTYSIAFFMPGIGAAGFLVTFVVVNNLLPYINLGNVATSLYISDIPVALFLGIPAYYVTTAPVTIPGALATAWLVRRYAPVPPKPPPEDFDAY